ncbi:NUDIX hydrolase [Haliscomenobacter hydrossis DSM 1100]|uniref:NUDIX hydrolase n=2 Tax=Haliscomenobacter TaxID=2349 RepID=F4KX41_HALH1|nr:NUDIX hydrolase [Haliscomenobacter hydrossis DSM 1100]
MTEANFTYRADSFKVAIDCILLGFDQRELKILLIHRNFEPAKGSWSLMGGFLNRDESLNDSAKRILYQLTGLEDIYLEQIFVFGDINRDPVERVLSVCFYALIKIEDYDEALGKSHDAHWFPVQKRPKLVFDHEQMVEATLNRLRRRAGYQPIGFELLPEKFTMMQLLNLYEAIYQRSFDVGNFSKKILSLGILVKTDEKLRGGSKKGSYLYSFDQERYDSVKEKGFRIIG